MKVEIKKNIITLGDLFDPFTVEEKRKILKKMGAKVLTPPNVKLGNLRVDNIHAYYYISPFEAERTVKEKDGSTWIESIPRLDWKIDEHLTVRALSLEESLRWYAQSIKEEYKDLTDEELAKYRCLGRKRFYRARDEMLRRGIIEKVGELSVYEHSKMEKES